MKRLLMVWLGALLIAGSARAQDEMALGKLYLGAAQCTLRSGTGSPESSVVGKVCDVYINTTSGEIYRKLSGTGNTGWVGPSALTKTDDTNVTLTLGGSASTSLLNPASITAGWTGQLSVPRGGTGALSWTTNGVLYGQGASTLAATAQGGANTVLAANSGAPAFTSAPTVTSLAATSFVGSSTYSSGTTGWRATSSDGAGDFQYLQTRELRAQLFTADSVAVLAGSQRITKSYSTISQTFTCPAAGGTSTLWVYDSKTFGDAAVFVSGDAVVIHTQSRTTFGPFSITDCVGVVTSYADGSGGNAGQQSWTFTRGSGGNAGAMTASTTVSVNELVLDYGVSGNGFLHMTAVDGAALGNSPYYDVTTFATAPVSANMTTRCRLGNLKGITTTTEYGLLCGNYSGNAYFLISDTNAEIVGIPLILKVSGTPVVKIDPSVPSIALGASLPSWSSGTGIWMGQDSGVYKFRIGAPSSGNRFVYDTDLTLVSANLTIDSIGVHVAPAAAASWTLANGYTFSASSGNLGTAAWDTAGERGVQMTSTWGGGGSKVATLKNFVSTGGGTSDMTMSAGASNVTTSLINASNTGTSTLDLEAVNISSGVGTITMVATTNLAITAPATTMSGSVSVTGGLNALGALTPSQDITWANDTGFGLVSFTGGKRFLSYTSAGGVALGANTVTTINASEMFVQVGGTSKWKSDGNGDIIPITDNTQHVGVPTKRFAYMTALSFNTSDLSFDNGYALTEHTRLGIAEDGIGLVDSTGELVAFFGKTRTYLKGGAIGDVDDLTYTQNPLDVRLKMDPHPELREIGRTKDGKPIHRTKADVAMPDPTKGKTNKQRKAGGQ